MPTQLSATSVMHLSDVPEMKTSTNGNAYTKLRGYTVDRVRNADGEYVKEYTNIEAMIFGKQAEWMARDCQRGSLVAVSGTVRVRAYEKRNGNPGASLEYTVVTNAVCLDRKQEGGQEQRSTPPSAGKASVPPHVPDDADDEPPF